MYEDYLRLLLMKRYFVQKIRFQSVFATIQFILALSRWCFWEVQLHGSSTGRPKQSATKRPHSVTQCPRWNQWLAAMAWSSWEKNQHGGQYTYQSQKGGTHGNATRTKGMLSHLRTKLLPEKKKNPMIDPSDFFWYLPVTNQMRLDYEIAISS